MMSNYKKRIAAVALSVAVGAGFVGVAASTVDDGAKANGLRVVEKDKKGDVSALRANGL
jgi:hypothetical protein